MSRRKRILYLSPCWPGEKSFGTQLRVQQVARALKEIGELNFIVVRFDDDNCSATEEYGPGREVIDFVELHNAPPRRLPSRLRCAFDPYYLGAHGQVIDPVARDRVLSQLASYDLVWLHHMHVVNMFARWQWNRSVMDVDDVPSLRQLSVYRNGRTATERWRGGFRFLAAKQRERFFPERFTLLSVCSARDREHLNLKMPVHVIPNGFPRPATQPKRNPASPPRIGFVGVFNYPPNLEGVRWFVEKCWSKIEQRIPGARLRLVGRGSETDPLSRTANVDALGWLAETEEEIATWSVMIVPIQFGAGTRVKITEGFGRKCPIVSTTLGAYGYDLRHGEELLLADTAEDFAAACIKLIEDPASASAMAERAYRTFLEKWTWEAIAPRVWEAAEDCLRRTHAREND